ncbi:MAG: hypothetical protein ACYTFG_02240 [Planctomycetota bacterium]
MSTDRNDPRALVEKAIASDDPSDWEEVRNYMERQGHIPAPGLPVKVGDTIFVRCVTYHHVGKVKAITGPGGYIILEPAAWVAYSGQFSKCLANGFNSEEAEVEPMPHGAFVAMQAIVDMAPWVHEIPALQVEDDADDTEEDGA